MRHPPASLVYVEIEGRGVARFEAVTFKDGAEEWRGVGCGVFYGYVDERVGRWFFWGYWLCSFCCEGFICVLILFFLGFLALSDRFDLRGLGGWAVRFFLMVYVCCNLSGCTDGRITGARGRSWNCLGTIGCCIAYERMDQLLPFRFLCFSKPPPLSDQTPVAAGFQHRCYLASRASQSCWPTCWLHRL